MFKNWRKVLLAGIISISLVGTGYVGHDLISTPNVSAESASKNAPGYQKNAAATQLDEIIERGYIRIGMTGDYKPFTYLNPKTNEYEGYDVDAAKELGKDLGVEVQFVSTTWPDMLKDLQADKFDIAVGGVTRNTARQKNAYVSQGYISFGKVPLIRAEDKDKYLTIEDINKPSVRIGVNPGGTNESFVRQYLSNANVTVVQNNLDIPGLVADGTYDVMITDTVEAMLYARKDERLYAALTDKPFTNSEKGYMIPRGDFIYASYLEMWMDEMKLQGKFDALYKKWIE
ncbi:MULTISPECIES: transporter substrate-binding domain-containing protein [Cytobacillus]|uniref:Transporter substrate-binding domain-containing protein n=1 Tax=Cytobacillus pseudoceanisediminis TaxID=3051614 RepID=A0ABZ2ZMV5_9BACI|nr:transporter substrate-binding domain-containing protein [Cytobacillus oceanisediminis]MCM3403480.1 transporter substrate-binding domain-containing protein [Cytobacillus oceanisediminis]MDK7667297.1 transporter substrate-binding domain-containing protein [Cytobacillus oceanisediminis]QOK26637.1 transporter substrate-binding domain-containing protein [Cytobacillus oceanisediminis]